jgi:UDP-3-O-[3-hydroxymyristoyl] N-acetylglucosamine deacetylase
MGRPPRRLASRVVGHLQRSLREAVEFSGTCLHSGRAARAVLQPARAGAGIVFETPFGAVPASALHAQTSSLTTTLALGGAQAWTVEHLLSALAAFRVQNCRVVLSGEGGAHSVPILDGSAAGFAGALVGNTCDATDALPQRLLVVRRAVKVVDGGGERFARLSPTAREDGLWMDVTVDFGERIGVGAGGRQRVKFFLSADGAEGGRTFLREIAAARTFCFDADLAAIRARGLARGGSLENALVFGAAGECLTPGGLRFADEPGRHKVLDCLGDVAGLCHAGSLVGEFEALRPGHDLNRRLLVKLLSSPDNYQLCDSG